ncbi:MAG: HAMP domain-containing sensor histidine kinase [Cyclobacteriaceae bacterium]
MTKNRPIQFMIIMAIISLVGIIVIQIYWVSQAVSEQEEEFDHNVRMSLRAVADNMCQIDGNELIPNKPIDRVSRNYFVARLRYNIEVGTLERLISQQFTNRGIEQDYEYGVYNCENDQMVFGNQVAYGKAPNEISIPELRDDEYYFGVYFPNKAGGLLSELNLWKFMSLATILMLVFFGYGLVVVLKQRRLSEIQKDFIDNVTHELKTPLATLRLAADALKNTKDATRQNQFVNIIDDETHRLEQQVDKILSSSVLESQGAVIRNDVDLKEVFDALILELKQEYPRVIWQLDLAYLPVFKSNSDCLRTILKNLVDNAVKYGNGQVGIASRAVDSWIEITISDNGPGIPDEFKSKVFDKFFRVPSANVHDVKGYGLGMYLVKENLKLIGGRCTVESNEGARITIKLPVK